jgi:hypothetical protein
MERLPNPGSPEAVEEGCRCAIFDNGHGKGAMGMDGVFWINTACPLHGSTEQEEESEDENLDS